MSSAIDETQGSRLEQDLLMGIMPDWHPAERVALAQAVLVIWGVDITQQTLGSEINMNDARARDMLSNMLQQFQDMADILAERSHAVFTDPDTAIQQAIYNREARLRRNSAKASEDQGNSDPELPIPTEPPDQRSLSDSAPATPLDESDPVFECRHCSYTCPEFGRLNRHTKEKHEKVRYPCSAPGCTKTFLRKDYRERRERKQHGGPASRPPSLPAAYRQLPVVERLVTAVAASPERRKIARTSYGESGPFRDGDGSAEEVVIFRFPCEP
ncbi:hypothetical protein PG994_003321 [Apiospora phragmitis]|uniref:C2H2-type domain-containing protein n=1 Tax=Apiospora phragmitis TaxID=2905665 RepID=A0ABR1VXU7_9PEZI